MKSLHSKNSWGRGCDYEDVWGLWKLRDKNDVVGMYVPCAEDLPPTSGIGWFTIEDEYGDGSRAIGTSVTFI